MRPHSRGRAGRIARGLECALRWQGAVVGLRGAGVILPVIVLLAALFIGLPVGFRPRPGGQAIRVRSGVVESVAIGQGRRFWPVPVFYTRIRVDGFILPVQALREYHPGDRVEVTYLRGPAGTVVVERIEPLNDRRE